ncbi:polyphenol oxidase family protein [Demequina aurantiaca]|uniref:polyphenol oxidase family protein n=1 Tax=Demequina aurantiaca TaxID=676200 RepID=UPI00078317C4|nr:polyphenol oxidase family protein [Demequina aurantiaca]
MPRHDRSAVRDGDAGLPVTAFFTTRAGGVSLAPYQSLNVADHVGDDAVAVERNRGIVSERAGAPVRFLNAAHGIAVGHVTAQTRTLPLADVLVASEAGVALGAIAADCAPVLIHDGASGAVAAVHCGREGLYRGVIDAAMAAIFDLRGGWSDGALLTASIGPSICGRCYEVPVEMRERVASRHPAARASTRQGTAALDIPRAIESRLAEFGFGDVVRSTSCTFEDESYFSHRRDGVTGRHAGVIVCEGPGGSTRIAR